MRTFFLRAPVVAAVLVMGGATAMAWATDGSQPPLFAAPATVLCAQDSGGSQATPAKEFLDSIGVNSHMGHGRYTPSATATALSYSSGASSTRSPTC